jgi:hypothetical protein
MIAKRFAANPASWAYPSLDILVAGSPSLHIVEFPWVSYVVGALQSMVPLGYETWGRVWSYLAMPVLYFSWRSFLERGGHGKERASHAAFLAAFSPLALIYFRSFQLDAWAMALLAVSTAGFFSYTSTGSKFRGAAFSVAFAAVLLLKPHWIVYSAALLVLPSPRARVWERLGWITAAVLPAIAWAAWNFYLSSTADNVFFSFAKSIERNRSVTEWWMSGGLYLAAVKAALLSAGAVGAGLLLFSFQSGSKNALRRYLWTFVGASAFLFFVLPRKFHDANYYYLPLVLPLGLFMENGLWRMRQKIHGSLTAYGVLAAHAATAILLSGKILAFVPDAERWAAEAGEHVHSVAAPRARVVAVSGSSPALLYYTRREGWTMDGIPEEGLESALAAFAGQGADYFVTTNVDELKKNRSWNVLSQNSQAVNDHFILIKLGGAAE